MMNSGVYFAEGTMFFISLRSSGSRPGQIPANILRRVAMFARSKKFLKFIEVPITKAGPRIHRDLVQSTNPMDRN
jgi:hypothetical protein